MKQQSGNSEGALHKAFELLIQIKGHRQAPRLLNLANDYLGLLLKSESAEDALVVSICTVRIRQP